MYAQPLLCALLILFEKLLHKFDVFIGHICYGVGVVAGEVVEPFAGDDLGVMGFGDLKPAAVDPSADGFVLVAEDGFHVLWCDDVGAFAEEMLQPFYLFFGCHRVTPFCFVSTRISQRIDKSRENREENK